MPKPVKYPARLQKTLDGLAEKRERHARHKADVLARKQEIERRQQEERDNPDLAAERARRDLRQARELLLAISLAGMRHLRLAFDDD